MAKSVAALKDILKREEAALKKLKDAIKVIAHNESKAVLRELEKGKKRAISAYRMIIKSSEKCPAVRKSAVKRKTAAKKSPVRKKKTTKKSSAKGRK